MMSGKMKTHLWFSWKIRSLFLGFLNEDEEVGEANLISYLVTSQTFFFPSPQFYALLV
jgi:hypothetical protein